MWGKSMEWGPDSGRVLGKKENKKPVTAPEVGSGRCGRRASAVRGGGQPGCCLSRLLLCPSSRHVPKPVHRFPTLPFQCAHSPYECYPVTVFSAI